MSFGIDEYVLGLQVPVCDAFPLVQEFEDQDNLSGVELRSGFVEAAGSPQVAEDFTTGAVVKLRES